MNNKKAEISKKKNQRMSIRKDSVQSTAKEVMNKGKKSGVASKQRGMRKSV